MILALLVACGSPASNATLDDDNWLDGSLVDDEGPMIASVEITAATLHDVGSDGVDVTSVVVDYINDNGSKIVTMGLQGTLAEDGSIIGDGMNLPFVTGTLTHDWPEDARDSVEVGITLDDTSAEGTFSIDGGELLSGAFSGPVSWEDLYL